MVIIIPHAILEHLVKCHHKNRSYHHHHSLLHSTSPSFILFLSLPQEPWLLTVRTAHYSWSDHRVEWILDILDTFTISSSLSLPLSLSHSLSHSLWTQTGLIRKKYKRRKFIAIIIVWEERKREERGRRRWMRVTGLSLTSLWSDHRLNREVRKEGETKMVGMGKEGKKVEEGKRKEEKMKWEGASENESQLFQLKIICEGEKMRGKRRERNEENDDQMTGAPFPRDTTHCLERNSCRTWPGWTGMARSNCRTKNQGRLNRKENKSKEIKMKEREREEKREKEEKKVGREGWAILSHSRSSLCEHLSGDFNQEM